MSDWSVWRANKGSYNYQLLYQGIEQEARKVFLEEEFACMENRHLYPVDCSPRFIKLMSGTEIVIEVRWT